MLSPMRNAAMQRISWGRRWLERCAIVVYTAVVWAAQPLLIRKLKRRALAEPLYGQYIPERFGYYGHAEVVEVVDVVGSADAATNEVASTLVWVHSVSLGETRAAAAMVAALRLALPHMRLLLTHSTATGRLEGKKLLQPGDMQVWLPWDTPAAVRRFVQHFRPRVGVLMETEVWPHLVAICRQQGMPLVLANARLNERSYRKALQWAALSRPAYAGLYAVWAQTAADARRLQHIGAPVRAVLGNVKFDVLPDAVQLARGQAWRRAFGRPVVVLASSREGEEALWLESLRSYWEVVGKVVGKLGQKTGLSLDGKGLIAIENDSFLAENLSCHVPAASTLSAAVQWLIVPRHPQRVDAVEHLLQQAGLTVGRRSSWGDAGPAAEPNVDVWLGDSLGEMATYYGMSDIAVLGGSFAPLGGQNLIEAAACGCPVIAGPHTFNFAQATEAACQAGAAWQVVDMDAAVRAVHTWLQDELSAPNSALNVDAATDPATPQTAAPIPYPQARGAALQFAAQHRGAAQAYAQAIAEVVKETPSA